MKPSNSAAASAYLDDSTTWEDLNLDPRLLQALDQLGFSKPTLIQSSAIPLALEEKEISLQRPLLVLGRLPPTAYLLFKTY